MWVVEINLNSVWGIGLDLIPESGSALTWFFCGGRNILGFSVWIEIHLVFVSER